MYNLSKKITLLLLVLSMHVKAIAQSDKESENNPKNLIKLNLTSLILKNYNFQYERVLNKRISVVLGYRFMPNGPLPFQKTFISTSNDPANALGNFRLSNSAITPELRFYAGKKGYGHGFYFAPFYRYANFKPSGITINFTYDAGNPATMDLSGDVRGNSFGLLIGAQWSLAKNISLDWQIIGAHSGKSDGLISGVASRTHSASEQANILTKLKEIDWPLITETYSVTSNGASMILNGPWGGLRAGLTLGIKF